MPARTSKSTAPEPCSLDTAQKCGPQRNHFKARRASTREVRRDLENLCRCPTAGKPHESLSVRTAAAAMKKRVERATFGTLHAPGPGATIWSERHARPRQNLIPETRESLLLPSHPADEYVIRSLALMVIRRAQRALEQRGGNEHAAGNCARGCGVWRSTAKHQ